MAGETGEVRPFLPKTQSSLRRRFWTDTPLPEERKSQILYRENDILNILDLLKDPNKKAVLLEGKLGAGKSTTIIELAFALERQGRDYSLFNPKDYIPFSYDQPYLPEIAFYAEDLEYYARKSNKRALVAMDSGDYLFCIAYGGVKENYEELKHLKTRGALTAKQSNVLDHYQACERLIRILVHPQFQIVTTWHNDWPIDNREPSLYYLWRQAIPYGSEYSISPHVPPEKGAAYLYDRVDLHLTQGIYPFILAIAKVLEFGELKDIKAESLKELVHQMVSAETQEWPQVVEKWARLHTRRQHHQV